MLMPDWFHVAESLAALGATHDTSQKRKSEVQIGLAVTPCPVGLLPDKYEGTLGVSLADGDLLSMNIHPAAATT